MTAIDYRREWCTAAWLGFAVGLVFHLTYSTVPTSDGFSWIRNIDEREWQNIFWPFHLLPEFILVIMKQVAESVTGPISTLRLVQSVNLVLAAISVSIFYFIARSIGMDRRLTGMAALCFGFSFGFWYFANGELHHFGLLCLLAIFLAGIRYQRQASQPLAILIGVLHAIANAMHEEHILFMVPISALMLTAAAGRHRWRYAAAYVISMGACSLFLFATVGVIVAHVRTVNEFLTWLLPFRQTDSPAVYFNYVGRDLPWLRLVKGAATAVHYGAQVIVDLLRYTQLRARPSIVIYAGVSVIAFGIIGILFLRALVLIWRRKGAHRHEITALAIWMLTYKFLLNSWFYPESAEYHVASIPPVILLIFFGLSRLRPKALQGALAGALTASLITVNLFAGILPWKSYGAMLDQVRQFAKESFRPTDLFISCESSLDSVLDSRFEVFSTKAVLRDISKKDFSTLLRKKIADAQAVNRRVFLYNFIPSAYALNTINFYNPHQTYSSGDFEEELKMLMEEYEFRPFFSYWEGNYSQPYLLSPGKDWIWQILKK